MQSCVSEGVRPDASTSPEALGVGRNYGHEILTPSFRGKPVLIGGWPFTDAPRRDSSRWFAHDRVPGMLLFCGTAGGSAAARKSGRDGARALGRCSAEPCHGTDKASAAAEHGASDGGCGRL